MHTPTPEPPQSTPPTLIERAKRLYPGLTITSHGATILINSPGGTPFTVKTEAELAMVAIHFIPKELP